MKNIRIIKENIDVSGIVKQLEQNPEDWGNVGRMKGTDRQDPHTRLVKSGVLDKINTLIHECLHACCYVSGLTQKDNPLSEEDKEETVVNNLANTLHIVFRDNPWFLKLIQEALKKTKTKEK